MIESQRARLSRQVNRARRILDHRIQIEHVEHSPHLRVRAGEGGSAGGKFIERVVQLLEVEQEHREHAKLELPAINEVSAVAEDRAGADAEYHAENQPVKDFVQVQTHAHLDVLADRVVEAREFIQLTAERLHEANR